MLLGSLLVRGNNHCIYQFDVSGVDSSSAMSLHLYARSYNAMQFMCNPEASEDDSYLDDRAVTIGIGKVSVQTKKYIDENGKSKKCAVNSDLFCRLAALVRYVKSHCFVQNEEGYTGLMLASGEFEISTSTKYIIPFEMKKEILATVTLCFGAVTNLHIKTDDFELRLDEDENAQQELFPQIKDAWTSGIKLNEEYLGFPLKPVKIEEVQSNNGMYTCIEDIVKAHPEKELSWLLKRDYRIVDDDNLEEICNYIMNWDGYVYYDTETTGLNINFKSREGQADQCVGIVLSVKDGESFYFPMQMKAIKNLCGGDHYYFMERYMRPILEGKKLVAHNMSFDWKVAYIYDINANIVADTMAIIRLTLGAAKSNYPMGLKENAKLLLHRDSLELSDLVIDNSWGESDIKFWDLPYELVRLYACADTDNTKGLHDYAINTDLLNQYNARKINEIEVAFSFAVAYQEFYGHRIDVRNMEQVRKEVGAEQDKYMKLMVDLVGHEFNPNSPKQLQQVMYDELEYPKQISRKSGRVSTDKEALQKLAEITDIEDNIKYPFCKWLLKYREAEGVRKIIDKFPEHATEDGYVFSSVMQYGTETGRVSINKPNYQSYNDPIKKNVIPRPGFWAFDTDYSSVEYRVLGNMVRNKNIMENFKDPDFDYHTYQAAHMYGVPYASVTKKLRKAAKGINFGLPYGMGDESLGVRVFGEATPENTRKAASLRTAYFKGQEDIRDWFEYHRDRGVHEGFTETYFGRRRYYDKSKFSDGAIRRQAGNQVIQGTAADIYKTAVGRVFKRICREGWLGKVLLSGFIHDELFGEVSNDINPGVFLKVLREEFEVKITNEDGTPWCPLYMGFGYGMSWYEAKSVELPIKLQWEIVENYGDNGFPNWVGDGRAFCDTIPDMLRDFEVRDISSQILSDDAQGKEIKPALNSALLDCVKTDVTSYVEGISDFCQLDYLEVESIGFDAYLELYKERLIKHLDKMVHIQNVLVDEHNIIHGDFARMPFESARFTIEEKDDKVKISYKGSETQGALDLFCMLHDIDRSKVNLLDIAEYDASASNNMATGTLLLEDDEELDERGKERLIDSRIETLGMYLDVDNGMILLQFVPEPYLGLIRSSCNAEGRGYKVRFHDLKAQKKYDCQAWISSDKVNYIQQVYLQYFKAQRR